MYTICFSFCNVYQVAFMSFVFFFLRVVHSSTSSGRRYWSLACDQPQTDSILANISCETNNNGSHRTANTQQ